MSTSVSIPTSPGTGTGLKNYISSFAVAYMPFSVSARGLPCSSAFHISLCRLVRCVSLFPISLATMAYASPSSMSGRVAPPWQMPGKPLRPFPNLTRDIVYCTLSPGAGLRNSSSQCDTRSFDRIDFRANISVDGSTPRERSRTLHFGDVRYGVAHRSGANASVCSWVGAITKDDEWMLRGLAGRTCSGSYYLQLGERIS